MNDKKIDASSPIGFFDSGVGGISVLKRALEIMPYENYIYVGDSKNAPYGTKTVEEVRDLSFEVVEFLLDKGVKGIVVACNTATSAAVAALRKKYEDLPIVGIEPALKPAVKSEKDGKIVIMATPMTLAEGKFTRLLERLGGTKKEDIIPMPCAGLMEIIEAGHMNTKECEDYLKEKFKPLEQDNIATVVLGCTHYPFIQETLAKVLPDDVDIIDGSLGTSREMQRRLSEKALLTPSKEKGSVKIYNSSGKQELIDLSYELLK
ncbi:MAG: glutamate racemase [Sarcina sp.]